VLRLGQYTFSPTDVSKTFSNVGMWWDHLTNGIDASSAEPHGRRLANSLATALGTTEGTGTDLAADLTSLGRALAAAVAGAETSEPAAKALEAVWQAMRAAGASMRASGVLATSGSGHIQQVNVSDGGVPKRAIESAEVGYRGLVGDRQRSRQHHGRPWQALCLWSGDVIDTLASQGHPIAAGCAGENLTIGGLDWAHVRPGMLLRLGSVLAETSSWAIPCRHNAQWFSDGDFNRMSHERGPVARVYATVLEPGVVASGSAVAIEG